MINLALQTTRFLVLLLGIVASGTHLGRIILLAVARGEAPWHLSMPLFAQSVANLYVAIALLGLAFYDRGHVISWGEKIGWGSAVLACFASVSISLAYGTWIDRWDWMSSVSVTLILIYSAWVLLRYWRGVTINGASKPPTTC